MDYQIWRPHFDEPAVTIVSPSAGDENRLSAAVPGDETADVPIPRTEALARGEKIHLWLQMATEMGRMPAGRGWR